MLKIFISAVLIVFKFFFRCSQLNRSWPAASRDGKFLIAFTNSCIVNGSVNGIIGAVEVQYLLATEFLDVRNRSRVWICICSQNILVIR